MSNHRPKYANLIKKIDNRLLHEDPKRTHIYTFSVEVTPELKEVLLNEYSPHWEGVYFTKTRMWLITRPLEMQGPILTPSLVGQTSGKAPWKFTLPEAGDVYPEWVKSKRGR